jgi:hypothetical protein
MDLFKPIVPADKQHPIFKMILLDRYRPERLVVQQWANGFIDRDGKFVREIQTTFESGLWELFLHAALREWGLPVDMSYHTPDFVVGGSHPFGLEATIAAPAAGGKPAYGYDASDVPEDFTQFNIEATLRICNSFDAKVKKYRQYYSGLRHMSDLPFVIAIAPFDRPLAHLSANRPIIAALYGLYHDEAETPREATKVVSYNVDAAPKNDTTSIDVGLFCTDAYADVSAVICSSLVTWGKLRALATNPDANTMYITFHPAEGQLLPVVRKTPKRDYIEHLLDGVLVLHNPFARRPLPKTVFAHPRIAQMIPAADGELVTDAPDDFLLVRTLFSVSKESDS